MVLYSWAAPCAQVIRDGDFLFVFMRFIHKGLTIITLAVLLHRHHGQVSLDLDRATQSWISLWLWRFFIILKQRVWQCLDGLLLACVSLYGRIDRICGVAIERLVAI